MADTFYTNFSRHLEEHHLGFEVQTQVNGLELFICFYLGDTDFDIIPSILPIERFDNESSQIHVGELTATTDINDELESILSHMHNNDTAVFFCQSEYEIKTALAFLNFAVDEE